MEMFHEKSSDPDNIANTFLHVLENLSQQFSALDMEGEVIGLILVILPEARDIDGMRYILSNAPSIFLQLYILRQSACDLMQKKLKMFVRNLEFYITAYCPV